MSGTNRSPESQHVLSSGNYACSPNTRSLFSKRSQYMPLQGYLFLVSKHLTYTSSLRDVTLLIQFSRTTSRKQFSLICAAKLSHSQQGAPRFFKSVLSLCTSYNWSLTLRIICSLSRCLENDYSSSVQKVVELLILRLELHEKSVIRQSGYEKRKNTCVFCG